MPQVAVAIVSSVVKVAGTVLSATAAKGVVITTLAKAGVGLATAGAIGSVAALGATIAQAAAINAAIGALSPKPRVQGGVPSQVTKGALQPRGVAFGRMGVGGNTIAATTHGPNGKHRSFIQCLSMGPIRSIESVRVGEDVLTWTGADGNASAPWTNRMRVYTRLGEWNQTAMQVVPPVSNDSPVPQWTTNHRLLGVAAAWWIVETDSKLLARLSDPLWTIVGQTQLIDPRTGSLAAADDCDRPHLVAYNWLLGLRSPLTNVLYAGKGHPVAEIDVAAYAAGVTADIAAGRRLSAYVLTTDDRDEVLKAMLQAGGSVPIERGGLQSVMLGTLQASVGTLTEDDLVGGLTERLLFDPAGRPNRIAYSYMSEAHRWRLTPAAEPVTDAAYVTADGRERTVQIAYTYVPSADQAGKLAALDLVHAREERELAATFKPSAQAFRVGECVTFSAESVGIAAGKYRITRQALAPDGTVQMTLRAETDAKYAWANGQTGAAPSTAILDQSALVVPAVSGLSASGVGLDGGGGRTAIIRVQWTVPDSRAIARIVVEGRTQAIASPPTAAGPITTIADTAVEPGRIEIPSPYAPGALVEVRAYFVSWNGTVGPTSAWIPVTLPNAVTVGSVDWTGVQGRPLTLFDLDPPANALVNSTNSEVVAARGGQASLSARFTQVNTAWQNGDASLSSSISSVSSVANGASSNASTALAATTDINGRLAAGWSVTVAANGRISGMRLLTQGQGGTTVSTLDFDADKIRFWNTNTSAFIPVMEVSAGQIRINGNLVQNSSIVADAVSRVFESQNANAASLPQGTSLNYLGINVSTLRASSKIIVGGYVRINAPGTTDIVGGEIVINGNLEAALGAMQRDTGGQFLAASFGPIVLPTAAAGSYNVGLNLIGLSGFSAVAQGGQIWVLVLDA